MIYSVGEILADMVGDKKDGKLTFGAFCGGAPFNVAVNAKQAGAKAGFLGRVGKDPVGRFLAAEAEKAGLDRLDIQTDDERNTTLAFVTLTEGERDFAFYRHDTADYHIDTSALDFSSVRDLNTVHIGSLMLSEEAGRAVAADVYNKARAAGKTVSFDVNFRMDIYKDFTEAVKACEPYVNGADIVKFSDDEIKAYTGTDDVTGALKRVCREGAIILVTLGSRGSMYYYNGKSGTVPTEKVKPVDTTGAGDAFFGTFLAVMDGAAWNTENIENALIKANKAGAAATQFTGAIKL